MGASSSVSTVTRSACSTIHASIFSCHSRKEVDRPTLTSLFRRAGYQSVGLYPALSWDRAERAYYGFDLFLDGRDLGCDQLVAESALPLYDAGGFLVSLDLQSEIILCV